MPMPCAILSATMSSSIWQMTMRSSSSTRPAFSSRAKGVVRCGAAIHWFGRQDYKLPDRPSSLPTFSRHGHAFHRSRRCIFRRNGPTIPIVWEATYVPADTGFATKPKLATAMIARAIAASVPFKWVAADTVYGCRRYRRATTPGRQRLCARKVSRAHVFRSWGKRRSVSGTAADIASTRRFVRLETPVGRGRNQRAEAA